MLAYENNFKRQGFQIIIGIDEAGRGPLAGPVTAAAVYLTDTHFHCHINDSKKMTPLARQQAAKEIHQKAYIGVGTVGPSVIDRINILNATFQAMHRAVQSVIKQLFKNKIIDQQDQDQILLLVDGNRFISRLPYAHYTIVQGDSKSLSVACASIIAKVTRDAYMEKLDRRYPEYGFCQHKGYPTLQHRLQIQKNGLSVIHRKSFSHAL